MTSKKYTIGIVGLSYPIIGNAETERPARDFIEKLKVDGHKVIIGKTVFSKLGYKTASIEDRVRDLENMFANPEVEIILNNTGGYSSNEILEYLDYHLIKKNPKVFVGYSDITAVNLAIYTKTGIQTTDGHTIDDYEIDPFWFERVLEVIETKKKYELKNSFYYKDSWSNKDFISRQIEFLEGKKMSAVGKLIAGNISTFNLLLGTPYLPDLNNTILFLEHNKAEIQDLPAMERMLWQIRQNGIFKKISGLIIGLLEPEVKKEETKAQNMESILTRLTQNYDFPVLFNAQFGHIYPSWVLQNGSSVKIKGKQIFINN